MKILSLGLDNLALDKHSALARRIIEYGELVERYTVVVPSRKNEQVELSGKVKIYGSGGGNKLTQFFKIYNLAKKLLRDESYDVITVQDQYYLALIGLKLARKFKIGLEIQVHGFEKFSGVRKIIAKHVLSRASVVRCVSQRLKKQLIDGFGVLERKITVVPIHVDTILSLRDRASGRSNLTHSGLNQRLPRLPTLPTGRQAGQAGRSDYGAPRDDTSVFIFLTVGRLVAVKNVGLQIEAMVEVVKKYPVTELWIIGDGPELNNLKRQILNLKLEKNIVLFGRKDVLENYYREAGAFLLTSNSEGWGLAIIEAAYFGLPIIMTDVGCAGEVIKDGTSGLVIPVGHKQKLVEAMLKIIEDKNLRSRLGENARMAVSRLPSKAEILDLYNGSWQRALAERN